MSSTRLSYLSVKFPKRCHVVQTLMNHFIAAFKQTRCCVAKKNYTTAEMEIDLTVRHFNASLLQPRFAPAQDIPVADGALPQRNRRRRLNHFDVPIETTRDLFRKLATNGLDALRSDWKRAFWSLIGFQPPGNSYSGLKARGFVVRFSHKSPLTADEKERIKAALSDLADQGPAIMGWYRYVANWNTQLEHMQGGTHRRRCTHKAVHTQGGTHKRRSVATAGVMLFKGPQARRYT